MTEVISKMRRVEWWGEKKAEAGDELPEHLYFVQYFAEVFGVPYVFEAAGDDASLVFGPNVAEEAMRMFQSIANRKRDAFRRNQGEHLVAIDPGLRAIH